MIKMKSWHTIQERRTIKRFGGKPLQKYGYDGLLHGKPVEVRSIRKDHRFRIQKNVHQVLVRKKGSYIFCGINRTKKVSASRVTKLMPKGKWYKDRKYPHKFVTKKDIF